MVETVTHCIPGAQRYEGGRRFHDLMIFFRFEPGRLTSGVKITFVLAGRQGTGRISRSTTGSNIQPFRSKTGRTALAPGTCTPGSYKPPQALVLYRRNSESELAPPFFFPPHPCLEYRTLRMLSSLSPLASQRRSNTRFLICLELGRLEKSWCVNIRVCCAPHTRVNPPDALLKQAARWHVPASVINTIPGNGSSGTKKGGSPSSPSPLSIPSPGVRRNSNPLITSKGLKNADDSGILKQVALKIIPKKKVKGNEAAVWGEMKVLEGLDHENIVRTAQTLTRVPTHTFVRSSSTNGSSRGPSIISLSNLPRAENSSNGSPQRASSRRPMRFLSCGKCTL